MSNFKIEGPGGISQIKIQRGYNSDLPIKTSSTVTATGGLSVGGISTGTPATLGSASTVTFTPSTVVTQHTPTQAETINFSTAAVAGTEIFLEVITSGASSFVLTFGSNTKTTGTLATGTTTAKTFIVAFVSDGTNWVETSRTTAM